MIIFNTLDQFIFQFFNGTQKLNIYFKRDIDFFDLLFGVINDNSK